MAMITRVLLLAVIACVAIAQHTSSGGCLCLDVNGRLPQRRLGKIVDIEIHPISNSCDKVEAIIRLDTGSGRVQYCLDPNLPVLEKLMKSVVSQKKTSPTRPSPTTTAISIGANGDSDN